MNSLEAELTRGSEAQRCEVDELNGWPVGRRESGINSKENRRPDDVMR